MAASRKQQAQAIGATQCEAHPRQASRPDNLVHGQPPTSEPVLGHIGQMVVNEKGQERFLGAHTGIHFLSSVSLQAREWTGESGPLPEWLFTLFFTRQQYPIFRHQVRDTPGPIASVQRYPFQHYAEQISLFYRNWGSVYPIVDSEQLTQAASDILLRRGQNGRDLSDPETCLIFQLHCISAINAASHNSPREKLQDHDAALASLFPRVFEAGSLEGLRGLLLYTVLLQIEGRFQLAVLANGVTVRLAQSLGLHRHSRRFRHSPTDVELRRRLWWSVFICDT